MRAADGIALVRHGARSAHALLRRRLAHLADLRLHQERNVARDLAGGEHGEPDAVEKVDPRVAMRLPRGCILEPQAASEALSRGDPLHSETLLRARGAAPLHGDRDTLRLG